MVFCGGDGLDELTTTTVSDVWELDGGAVKTYTIDPVDLGIPVAEPDELLGGDAAANVAIARRMLEGETGAVRDIVTLNAAAALVVAGVAEDLRAGLDQAVTSIEAGKAAAVLETFVRTSASAAARAADED
jgi:anthranilate phosphoribosyltransferase